MLYIHVIYIVKRARLLCSHPHDSRPPSILPSLASAVNRSIRIQLIFYYLFKIISSLRTLLKHAHCYLNRLLISRLQLHILSSSSEDSMNLQIADVVWKETFNIVFDFSISSLFLFFNSIKAFYFMFHVNASIVQFLFVFWQSSHTRTWLPFTISMFIAQATLFHISSSMYQSPCPFRISYFCFTALHGFDNNFS